MENETINNEETPLLFLGGAGVVNNGQVDVTPPKKSMADLRAYARTLFLTTTKTQKEIAEIVGVSEQSLSKWANEGDWEPQRKSLTTTRSEQLRMLYSILEKMNANAKEALEDDDPATNPDSDGIIKIANAIQKLEREAGIGEMIQTYLLFMKFVQKEDLEAAKLVDKYFYAFIQDRLSTHS